MSSIQRTIKRKNRVKPKVSKTEIKPKYKINPKDFKKEEK
jgi:hypothetical protein